MLLHPKWPAPAVVFFLGGVFQASRSWAYTMTLEPFAAFLYTEGVFSSFALSSPEAESFSAIAWIGWLCRTVQVDGQRAPPARSWDTDGGDMEGSM